MRRLVWLAGVTGLGALLLTGCKNIEGGRAAPGNIGAACEEAEDCTSVAQPVCLRMPDGYCSEQCGGGLFDCDDQSICEALGDQAFYCLDGCLIDNGNADCREDYRCDERPEIFNLSGEVGVCVPKCTEDADCSAGQRCEVASGDCIARGEVATGGACTGNAQCNGGLCITSESFRGGYCSARCGSQLAGCEPGSYCATLVDQALCLDGCRTDRDCRADEGYKCREIATIEQSDGSAQSRGVCVPRCQSNAECADGQHCALETGDCEEGAGAPNPVGGFCAANGDCESGQCLRGERYPHGLCVAGCGGCPEGTVCGGTPEGERCLSACEADLDCRPGYICGAEGGCTARCQSDSDCSGDLSCSASVGRCVARSQGTSSVQEIDLGNLNVAGQLSETLRLQVPSRAVGVAILADGHGDDLMIIGEMKDPKGRTLYDFQDPFGSNVRFFPSEGTLTQFLPSSPRAVPQAGTYSMRFIKEGRGRGVNVRALFKLSDGDPQGGRLDVNFFFAGAKGISAGSAKGDADFQRAVDTMRQIYAQQDIELGQVSYCDLPKQERDIYGVIDSIDGINSELSRLFVTSGRAADLGCNPGRALNFFLVEEIVGGRAGYIILGISGGIPGPPGVHGTTQSGVAATMMGFRRNPVQLGQTLAHEGGHYLGLFHTTEAEGNAFDPLSDTPECTIASDRNRDGIVDYDECKGKGRENLMFWAAGDDAEQLSADQGFVLSRNPSVQ